MSIGGYNQLSLASLNTQLHNKAFKYQSARAALYAYLCAEKIKILYLPNYICDSIIPAIKSLNIDIRIYPISKELLPINMRKNLKESDSRVLIVNYFGLLSKQIKKLITEEPSWFIIDNSQALFCEHIEGTTSIYSPRKFLGIPDGGFLRTSVNINMPEGFFDASKNIGHLLLRAAGDTQTGYGQFLQAEQALECFIPKKTSIISTYLIKCADIKAIKKMRRRNYELLVQRFKSLNQLRLSLDEQVPLCYPLKLAFKVDYICKALIEDAIFLPRYWQSQFSGEIGQCMFENTLFLPIDERLTEDNVKQLSDIIEQRIINEYSR